MTVRAKSGFVVAAPHSGAGKTTVTLSLLAALSRRGLKVQSFKTGPDYIDPLHHSIITGVPAHNLDTWMIGPERSRGLFDRVRADVAPDVCLVEGVMGLFDGVDGRREEGSTAHLAKTLGLPVVLVVDARSMAKSAAAIVSGFAHFDPALKLAGVIWNRVGSPMHRRILDEAVEAAGLPPVLGAYGRDVSLSMGERHLGLTTPEDASLPPDWIATLAGAAENAVDLDRLLEMTALAPPARAALTDGRAAVGSGGSDKRKVIAVPRDKAYAFYYEDNFSVLRELGAELEFFKPVEGDAVPPGADALYLGGGYPELNAAAISGNRAFIDSIRSMHERGLPVYGECGGFMTMLDSLQTPEGERFRMAGVFPGAAQMGSRMARLGYREVTGVGDAPFAGLSARGHEFHYSSVERMDGSVARVYRMCNSRGEELDPEGYMAGSALGGYVHLHFRSNPAFVAKVFGL